MTGQVRLRGTPHEVFQPWAPQGLPAQTPALYQHANLCENKSVRQLLGSQHFAYFFICSGTINQSINQSIKPVTPRRRYVHPTDTTAVRAAHQRLSYATRSNDDIEWPVHSLMLSFHDLCSLLCDAFRPRRPGV